MGITGLLPALRSITDRVHLDELAGESVAVDAYSWLHKGVYSCAADLFHGRPTRQHVDFCMGRLRQLLHHRVQTVWLVFDGGELPAKRRTEAGREKLRGEARVKAEGLIAEGRLQEAGREIYKAVDVTPEMAKQLIEACRQVYGDGSPRVKWIVAPYEADAQLAYLEARGLATAVISEDSDLVLFGVKRLCVKLDFRTGYFEQVRSDRIQSCRDLDLRGCTLKRLRQMCILAGCDYVASVTGMGLKTAHRYLSKYGTVQRVAQVLRAEGRRVPDDYEQSVERAELTFCHQRVWCPTTKRTCHLSPVDGGGFLEDDSFLGAHIDGAVMELIASGHAHPATREPFSITAKGDGDVTAKGDVKAKGDGKATGRVTVRPVTVVVRKAQRTIRDFFK